MGTADHFHARRPARLSVARKVEARYGLGMDEVLIACGDVDLLRKIVSDLPDGQFKPIATKSGSGIAQKIAKRNLKLAVVHEILADGPGAGLCAELRSLQPAPPILFLTSGQPPSDGPFDRALKYPLPGPVFRNLLKGLAPAQSAGHDLDRWKKFYEELGTRLEALPNQNYFEALGIRPGAPHHVVVSAYDDASLRFHPDRYASVRDERWGAAIYERTNELFKSLTEGYGILTDRRLRKAYDRALSEGRIRLTDEEKNNQDSGPDLLENYATGAQGKKFLRLAQRDLARNDWAAALQNLRFAQSMEGDLPIIVEKIALCESNLKS